ncbi:hypothetical protein RRG08_059376 [Elysia crispata]|uniref:SH3 domain-containing protein n=1 Tax=Elysia crispata TaxID=231223 RepID=A0AAE1EEC3_9GAST|nr:hypothetical protein RRG08_059376 [Elysia crispata]
MTLLRQAEPGVLLFCAHQQRARTFSSESRTAAAWRGSIALRFPSAHSMQFVSLFACPNSGAENKLLTKASSDKEDEVLLLRGNILYVVIEHGKGWVRVE